MPGNSEHHAAAQRLPQPAKTGNRLIDSEQEAVHKQFIALVDACIQDRSFIVPLYSLLSERQSIMRVQPQGVGSADAFNKAPTAIGQLTSGEFEQWTLQYLCTKSDLTSADLLNAIKADDGALGQLLTYATRLPPSMKVSAQCSVKGIMAKVLDHYRELSGNKLKTFKKCGGIRKDGALNWSAGVYTLKIVKGSITEVTHSSTKQSVKIADYGLNVEHILLDNWTDGAALHRKPLPPIKLNTFFDKKGKKGPWAIDESNFKAKSVMNVCYEKYCEWESARAQASGEGGDQEMQRAKCQLAEMHSAKRKTMSKSAREKAMEVLQQKKSQRSISLKPEEE